MPYFFTCHNFNFTNIRNEIYVVQVLYFTSRNCLVKPFNYMMKNESIPKQEVGSQSDICFTLNATKLEDAKQIDFKGKENLVNVNRWHKIAGSFNAKFQLINANGTALFGTAKVIDYIKIQLPTAGKNCDWVEIESIKKINEQNYYQQIIMKTRPVDNPENKKSVTEHFFTEDDTSTFSIERKKEKVTAAVHGRNELPNIKSNGLLQKIRNGIIGILVMFGINTPQWKALNKRLLTKQVAIK